MKATESESDQFFWGENPFDLDPHLIDSIYRGREYLVWYGMFLAMTVVCAAVVHWVRVWSYCSRARPSRPSPSGQLLSGMLMRQAENHSESNGVMLYVYTYLAVTGFFCFYDTLQRHSFILLFRLGMVATINVPVLYILGAKHSPLSWLTGWSYEHVNVLHRWCGLVCVLSIAGHAAIAFYNVRTQYLITNLWAITGLIAGSAFILIGLTSIPWVRAKFYEYFYVIHIAGALVSLPCIFLHYPTAQPLVAVAVLSVVYDRVYRLLHDYKLVQCHMSLAPGQTVIVQIPADSLNWSIGQHVFFTVLGCGTFESHPFTIASSRQHSNTMDLIIRARQGFSRKLYNKTVDAEASGDEVSESGSLSPANPDFETKPSLVMRGIIHGPYGTPMLGFPDNTGRDEQAAVQPSRIVLISAGSGIAFTYPIWQEYQNSAYEMRSIWIVPDRDFTSWRLTDESMNVWVTKERGRPDVEALMDEMVGTNHSHETWVCCCGPEPLLRAVRNQVSKYNMDGLNVKLYMEKFGW